MNNLKSYTEYAVTSETTDFVIGFDFNYGTDAVNVTVDGVPATEVGYTVMYLNSTTMRLTPAVPTGVVRLQRETDIDVPDNSFTAGAKFIASNMDENFTQIRHAQQEVRDGFNKLSVDTNEIIDTLQVVGEAAQDAADAAEAAAQTANDAAAQVNDKVSYQDLGAAVDVKVTEVIADGVDASFVVDTSGKNQQQINDVINSKYVSIDDYLDINSALNAIQDTNAILLLNESSEYIVDNASTQFFSRIETNGKRAKVVITERTKLSTFGKDLYLKNINIVQEGKRVGVNDASTAAKSLFDFSMPVIDNSLIEDVVCFAVTNTSDLSSYVDDVGKTRAAGFANIRVNKSSTIRNVNHYGYSGFIAIESVSSSAEHTEDRVTGYNNETNIYVRASTFKRAHSKNIGIVNTANQKTYWRGMSVGVGTNGKAAIMSEADYLEDYVYENIWADYAIEKPLYVQSKKSNGFNIRARNCLHAGQAKHNKGVQEGYLILRDNTAIDSTSLTGVGAINGFSTVNVYNQTIKQSVKNKGRALGVYNFGDCVVDGLNVENLGVPITIGGVSGQNSGKLTIRNAVYNNCFSDTASIFERFNVEGEVNPKLTTLVFDNNQASIPQSVSAAAIPAVGADLENVENVIIKNSNWCARAVPYRTYSDTVSVHILNSAFDIRSVNNMYNSYLALSGEPYLFKANTFNCSLNIVPNDTVVKVANITCRKDIDDGLEDVASFWSAIDLHCSVSSVLSTNVMLIGANRSLSITANSGSSKISFVYDATTKTITPLYNVGSVFSTSKEDNKVCINIDASNRLNINVGNGLTWTQGAVDLHLSLT